MNKKKKIIIITVVFVLLAVVLFFGIKKMKDKKEQGGVIVKEIKAEEFSKSITLTGTVLSNNVFNLKLEDNIKLDKLNFDLGDKVNKGDKLFEIDFESFDKQIESLESDIEDGKINLKKLGVARLEKTSNNELIAMAELALMNANSSYDMAKSSVQKNQKLYDAGAISRESMDAFKRQLEGAERAVKSAQLDLKKIKSQVYVANKNDKNQDELRDYDKQIAQSRVEKSEDLLKDTKERIEDLKKDQLANISGTVSMKIADDFVGSLVPMSTLIYQISDLDDMVVKAFVKEGDISSVKLGNEVLISGEGIKKEAEVKGEVTFISPVATKQLSKNGERSVVEIQIKITEGVKDVMSGFEVECEVLSQKMENTPLLSFEMIVKEDDKDYVYVVNENNIVEKREVTLGETSDFDAVLLSGVEVGEKVILSPDLTVKDGVSVDIKKVVE